MGTENDDPIPVDRKRAYLTYKRGEQLAIAQANVHAAYKILDDIPAAYEAAARLALVIMDIERLYADLDR